MSSLTDVFRWLCIAAFLSLSIVAHAEDAADKPPPEPIPQRIDRLNAALQAVETGLQKPDLNDAALADLRKQTDPLAGELQDVISRLNPQIAGLKARLDQLGPKPDDKAPAESPQVTAERNEQQDIYNKTDELLKRARLLAVQVDQTTTHIATRRHLLFTQLLFQSTTGIANPTLWLRVIEEMPRDTANVRDVFVDWIEGINYRLDGWRMPAFWGLIALIFILYWPLSRMARAVLSREPAITDPSRFQKILATWWVAFIVAIVPIAAMFAVALVFETFELTNDKFQPFIHALSVGIIRVALAAGIARGLLAPTRPHWRLPAVDDLTAERIVRIALTIATVVSITRLFESLNDIVGASLPVSIALRGVGALSVAILLGFSLIGIFATPPVNPADECLGPPVVMKPRWVQLVRILAWALVLAITASVFVGYVALGAFIVDQIVWVSGVATLFYMSYVLIDEFIANSMRPEARVSQALAVNIGIEHQSLNLFGVLLSGVAHTVLFILATLLILAPWGVQSTDVPSGLRAAFFGLQVGDITLSLSGVTTALVLFIACYGATHVATRWLDTVFLPQTNLDIGLRNSIKTSISYLGFVIALLLALSYLGLNFERLAIVAGALSVGIGFGLQAIVNNFLSGLILLWERSVRVGDWIVIGSEQGVVRRINVRATEIETFDRALVIVPNANLVTGIVKNWVRTDRGGRLNIPIALGHPADPKKVRDILLASARSHELTLDDPAPQVFLASITPTAFNFELYAFVEDVSTIGGVKSDLYFDIYKRFTDAGIELVPAVPAPVFNIAGLDRLETLLKPDDAKSNGSVQSADE
jgi:small-conductance mechanosensitive channel